MDIIIEIGLNTACSKVSNFFTAKIFKTKTHYTIKLPEVEVNGLLYGNRTMRTVNRGFVLECTNNTFCEYSAGKVKKKLYDTVAKIKNSDIFGGIYKVTSHFANRFLNHNREKSFEGLKSEDVIEKYCEITGKWWGEIAFDGVQYKTVNEPYPL